MTVMTNRLLHCDCTVGMRVLPDNCIDLTVTNSTVRLSFSAVVSVPAGVVAAGTPPWPGASGRCAPLRYAAARG